MDKETLLSKLRSGMGEPNAETQMFESLGLSVRTIDAYAENILPGITDDAQVTDAFISGHQSILKAMGGQLRHEKSEFVKNYKPETPPPPQKEDNAELELLKKSLEEIKTQLNGKKKEQETTALRDLVKGKSKTLKVQNQALWNDVTERIAVTEGMNESTLEEAVKKAYEQKLKSYFGDGAEPYGGNGGGSGDPGEEQKKAKREAFAERMRKRGKLPKKEE